jgi:mannan polymerase II complex MNN10 subunit
VEILWSYPHFLLLIRHLVLGTPNTAMSLSRSPSPVPGGGWASPGLNINGSGRSSPTRSYTGTNGGPDLWESSKMKNLGVNGYPSFTTQNRGFFTRHMRRISSSLPRFNSNQNYAEKEKLGRGRVPAETSPLVGRLKSIASRMGRKMKIRLLILFLILLSIIVFYNTRSYAPAERS